MSPWRPHCCYCGREVDWRDEIKHCRGHELRPRWLTGVRSAPEPRFSYAHRRCYLKAILGKRWRLHR